MAEGQDARTIGAFYVTFTCRILCLLLLTCTSTLNAHILQNFSLMEVRREMGLTSSTVSVSYFCRLKPAALSPPDPLIDRNKDSQATDEEKESFFVQSRDYVLIDLYVMHQRNPVKMSIAEFHVAPAKEAFEMRLEGELFPPPAAANDELITVVDPVFMVMPGATGFADALTSDPASAFKSAIGGTQLLVEGRGVAVLTREGKPVGQMPVEGGVNAVFTFRRSPSYNYTNESASGILVAEVADKTGVAASSTTITSTASTMLPPGDQPGSVVASGSQVSPGAQQELRNMISRGDMSPWVLFGSLFAAMILGAAHALTPGHGKTVVAAYLVGSRGRIRDAVYLGLIVTFTHTFSVILLGIIALVASHYIVQEQLYAGLGIVSGLMVFGFGAWLFLTRLRAGGMHMHGLHMHSHGNGHSHDHGHWHEHGHDHSDGEHVHGEHAHVHAREPFHAHAVVAGGELHAHHEHEHAHPGVDGGDVVHRHDHVHIGGAHSEHEHADHVHAHGFAGEVHDHSHSHGFSHSHSHGGLTHSHGGHTHTHEIPDKLTLKGLITLGVAGGIVPCPDAIVVLLIAIALNKILLGLAVIGAFSVGLAAVLVAIGIMMVTVRPLLEKLTGGGRSRFTDFYLPVGSALLVMILGLGITIKVLVDMGIVSINI